MSPVTHASFTDESNAAMAAHEATLLPEPTPPAIPVAAVEPEPEPVVEPAPEPEPIAEPAKGKKPRDDPKARIAQLTAKLRDAERERDALKSAQEPPAPVTEPTKPAAAAVVVRAKPLEAEVGTKYPTYGDYVEDLSDWKAEQRITKAREELSAELLASVTAREASRSAELAYAQHLTRVEAFKKDHDDFDTVIEKINISEAMGRAIIAADRGPEIAYYLGQHPEEAAQLVDQTKALGPDAAPLVQSVLLSRLGAASSGSAPVTPRKLPNPPIQPVGSSPSVTDADELTDDTSLEDHVRVMNARDRLRRRA